MSFINSYAHHVDAIQNLPWDRLKFLDESHIVPRNIKKRKVLGLVNQRTWVKANDLHEKALSITLMTQLKEEEPLVFDIREESNDQWDFVQFVVACIGRRQLEPGDYLIVDNASIHGGSDSLDMLLSLLQQYQISLIYLPKYSPELNPCENVFSILKTHLRNCRNNEIPIWLDVVIGLGKVTYAKLVKFYDHCIFYANICKQVL